jgi:hypothetical protein
MLSLNLLNVQDYLGKPCIFKMKEFMLINSFANKLQDYAVTFQIKIETDPHRKHLFLCTFKIIFNMEDLPELDIKDQK